jgi:xanthine dehydrogenase accessory factor
VLPWPRVRFEMADIDDHTVICVLSCDTRFDAELIALALVSAAGFVGAMGSRRTHDRRVASLRGRGLGEDTVALLRSPIGLEIGASRVEKTALEILAEVIAARSEPSAGPLFDTAGSIHWAPVTQRHQRAPIQQSTW